MPLNNPESLKNYCEKWGLTCLVHLASTFTSFVFRVEYQAAPAVLKILNEKGKLFEGQGASVLKCFDGNGAIRLFESDAGANLLEFADGPSLLSVVDEGNDGRATSILCDTILKLHSYSGPTPADLISMERNFRSLFEQARKEPTDSPYRVGAKLAEKLIGTEARKRVLHGDIHHENIMQSSQRGWVAIDPQCLYGENTYEFANTFYNPNGYSELLESADSIQSRSRIFSSRFGIDPKRILEFAVAYGCLRAAWCIEDGQDPNPVLNIAAKIKHFFL